jgi:Major Facilitator Superfamily
VTIIMLSAAVILLTAFAFIESRVPHPLLPLRVIADRTRGGSYLVIGIAGIAMFAVFLFLTYYLQATKGFTPIQTGLAFLPMPATIVLTATSVNIRFLAKVGPKPLLMLGTSLGAVAMVWFAQITPSSSYVGHILPGLIVMGVAMGNIFAPAIASATYGVDPTDTGVASAMVNTMQQVGGSIGTALLSSIFASSAASYAASHAPSAQLAGEAAVHGYTVAFWVAAGVFAFGTVVVSLVMESVRVREATGEPVGEPALAHS